MTHMLNCIRFLTCFSSNEALVKSGQVAYQLVSLHSYYPANEDGLKILIHFNLFEQNMD